MTVPTDRTTTRAIDLILLDPTLLVHFSSDELAELVEWDPSLKYLFPDNSLEQIETARKW